MTDSGQTQADGTPIFVQELDANGNPLTETYLSLETTGLGISPAGQTDVQGNPYYGVEMQGIEHVELELSSKNANFTIDDNAVCTGSGATQTCVQDAVGALPAPTVDVYGGTGNDSFTVEGIGAATTIMGGAGTDSTTVESSRRRPERHPEQAHGRRRRRLHDDLDAADLGRRLARCPTRRSSSTS